MFDLRLIRDNPAQFDKQMARRGLPPQSSTLLSLDEKRRQCQTDIQTLRSTRNMKSREIGILKKNKEAEQKIQDLAREVLEMKQSLSTLEKKERDLYNTLNDHLCVLPNILADDVVEGSDERDNVVLRTVGDVPYFSFAPKEHWQLGEALKMMDFSYASELSGSRFVVLSGDLAHLERALGNFMLDMHVQKHGYTEYQTPLLVRSNSLFGTGQLPKYEEDLFKTTTDHYLIPTAEVTLTNFAYDKIFTEEELPKRLTALTPCFRSEAGAAGRDTRGMLRQHQFYKVEMVSLTTPRHSAAEHQRMTDCAENVLKALNIPYRVVALCSGDTGFSARKTFDIEVWLPGQNVYREISSCSNCGDFQARRLKGRMREKGQKNTTFIHTLNGSGLSTGRTLIAVLENNQRADGSICIPEALRPYMQGRQTIEMSA